MKFNKENIISLSIIILFVLMIIFLDKSINLIHSEKALIIVASITFLLVFILLICNTCSIIKKKEYTTTVFIVLINIIQIINFIVLIYVSFSNFNSKDVYIIIQKNNVDIICLAILLGSSMLSSFLKSGRFKIKS